MYVIKADGTKEKFKKIKIIKTCLKAGFNRDVARSIADKIASNIYDGIPTNKVYRMIIEELDKRTDKSSLVYRIREAIADLDSVSFEIYVKKILEAHGYTCQWNIKLNGKAIDHQIDVIAKSPDNKLFLVECKRHFNPHRFTGVEVVFEQQARLEDLKDGFNAGNNKYNFDISWIITNTKFSAHAKKYALAKHIRLTGWNYKDNLSLENMARSKNVFPVTILKTDVSIHQRLLAKHVITLNDLLKKSKTEIRRITGLKDTNDLTNQAKTLLSSSD